ncbi:MAG: DJ-1/PfpI family protein [Oscillospiraceae bacterium]|nr:DJ-1/PfpI family protein [Oscillospiraceae bacterium]
MQKLVLLVLTDRWADWEAAYAIAGINEAPGFTVKTVAADLTPKASIGGLRAQIDYSAAGFDGFEDVALVILPGGYSWMEERHDEIKAFIKRAVHSGVPIAAVCGATLFLAKHGFLNGVKHTGDEPEYFFEKLEREQGYAGKENFVSAQLVNSGGFITANETAAVDFAAHLFRLLEIDTDAEINIWHERFKNGMFG